MGVNGRGSACMARVGGAGGCLGVDRLGVDKLDGWMDGRERRDVAV